MSRSDFDVIVIGAGYGGVTVAALAAEAGQRVLLVDKNAQAGGKAMTVRRGDYAFEMWPVFSTPANPSRFHELAGVLGIGKEARLHDPLPDAGESRYKSVDGEWRGGRRDGEDQGPLGGPDRLKEVYGVADGDLVPMAKMFGEIMAFPDDYGDEYDRIGMLEWMRGFELPESIISMLSATLNFVFVAPVDRLPASEGIRTMRDTYTRGGGRYHGGGYGRLAELAAAYVGAHGGEFLPKTRVERILVEDGRAAGIATATAELRAPVVVSNAGIHPTVLKLVDGEHLPGDYVERVRGLEPGWGFVGVRYFLDAPVLASGIATAYSDQSWWDDDRFAAAKRGEWPDASLVFMGVTTNFDPALAPEGHQIVQMGTLGSPDPDDVEMNETAIARAEATVREVWPGVYDHLVRREPYHAKHVSNLTRDAVVPGQGGECIGLGQVIGQCGRSKPDARTPLPGLYLTGCDAGGYGCGTHQAVDSGFNVAAMIAEDAR